MKYYVIINGNSSLDIQGLAIESLPNISKPLIRTTREEIDGRDGDIITKLGYSAYDKTLNIGLWGNYDINEVIAFFNQEGVITFSNEPDKYYKFSILNRIDFINQLEKFKKASITIHCQPFKYKEQEAKVIEEEEHTTSGTSFNLSDTLEAPLLMDLKGNTSQTGTPTPSSPIPVNNVSGDNEIKVEGKNLLPLDNQNELINGITFKVLNNGKLSINGTASSNITGSAFISNGNFKFTLNAGTYTLSRDIINPSVGLVKLDGTAIVSLSKNSQDLSVSFTLNQKTEMSFYVFVSSGEQINIEVALMINQGNQPSTYEPYNGTTYNIDLPVENLFDKDNANVLNAYLTITQSTIQSSPSDKCIWIECKGNTTYTITKMVQATSSYNRFAIASTTIEPAVGVEKYNQTADVNASSITYTTNSSAKYLVLFIYSTNNEKTLQDMLNSIQIEESSKSNTFTPYGTTPIELNKIGTYQDYIYKENDKWYLHKEVGKIASYNGETITTDYISTTEELTTGATIYYVLTSATNTEITYTPLIEQLNTLEEAQSKEGTTNINQVNNDLPFILDITYYTGDTSITITNDGNIYSKPLLELKGTGNINIYLNGIQVFVVSLNDEIIYIDTDKMEAYYQGTLKNRQVLGDYNNFKLQSGNNNIQVDGGYVEYLKITNYSRWV